MSWKFWWWELSIYISRVSRVSSRVKEIERCNWESECSDNILKHDITQTNKLAMVVAIWSAKEVGLNKGKRGEKKELWWKGIIERDITNLRRDINRLKRERWSETGGKGKRKIKGVNAKSKEKKNWKNMVTEELKQRLVAKKTKVKRYEQRIW